VWGRCAGGLDIDVAYRSGFMMASMGIAYAGRRPHFTDASSACIVPPPVAYVLLLRHHDGLHGHRPLTQRLSNGRGVACAGLHGRRACTCLLVDVPSTPVSVRVRVRIHVCSCVYLCASACYVCAYMCLSMCAPVCVCVRSPSQTTRLIGC
jgi:hypothetical protein